MTTATFDRNSSTTCGQKLPTIAGNNASLPNPSLRWSGSLPLHSLGQQCLLGSELADDTVDSDVNDDFAPDNDLFYAILNDPNGQAQFWEHYRSLAEDGPLSLAWQQQTLDRYFPLIDPSAQQDWDRWGAAYRSTDHADRGVEKRTRAKAWTDYEGEKAYLYQWVEERSAFFARLAP